MAAEVLRSEEDLAMSRVRRTPKVFQSTGESVARTRYRRDLRANLLPSIVRGSEEEGAALALPSSVSPARAEADGSSLENEAGQFYRLYKSIVDNRTQDQEALLHFLPREEAVMQACSDPECLAAASCTTFRDLVARCAEHFRRPTEHFVDADNPLLLRHTDQGRDLEELADMLMLDVERHETTYKGTVKTPGFCTMQVASRVPLVIKDPLALPNSGRLARVESEKLAGNGLYVIRLDFRPGEVRQLQMGLNTAAFRGSALGARLAALIDPERGALAAIVKMLRQRTADAQGVVNVLSGLLRELPEPLPPAPEPSLDTIGDDRARQRRLDKLAEKPRQTLGRLLEATDLLASVVAPVLPSLAHALDKLALICIREVDRVVTRGHEDYENLLQAWAKVEKERQALLNMFGAAGGLDRQEGTSGFELAKRVSRLEAALVQQETAYNSLMKDKKALEEEVFELRRQSQHFQRRTSELMRNSRTIQKTLSKRDRFVTCDPGAYTDQADGDEASQKAMTAQGSRNRMSVSMFDSEPGTPLTPASPQSARLPPPRASAKALASLASSPRTLGRPRKAKEDLAPFAVARSTQTETEFYFSEQPHLPEEMTFAEYGEVVRTTGRLYGVLQRFEWNGVSALYFLNKFKEQEAAQPQAAPERPLLTREAKAGQVLSKVQALQLLREKIEQAHQKASISQLEEELHRLQACAKDGFEVWIRDLLQEQAPQKALPEKLDPEELWAMCHELAHAEGLRRRVRQLEDNFQALLPLSEAVRGGDGGGVADNSFWCRIIQQVRQQISAPTPSKAPVRRASAIAAQVALDKGTLVNELAGIWGSLGRAEGDHNTLTRKPTQLVLQDAVKAFYLRKTGRSKLVEAAIVKLCRSVMELNHSLPKIALFSVMCDIDAASVIKDGLPQPLNYREADPVFVLDPQRLQDLPLDAAQVMAQLMRELKKRRSRRFLGLDTREFSKDSKDKHSRESSKNRRASDLDEEDVQGDLALPLQLVLAAGREVLASRSRATARFFELSLLAFTDFFAEGALSAPAAAPPVPSLSLTGSEEAPLGSKASTPDLELQLQQNEALMVTHLLKAWLTELLAVPELLPSWASTACHTAATQEEREAALVQSLWVEIEQHVKTGDFGTGRTGAIRQSIDLEKPVAMTAALVAQSLEQLGVLHLPPMLVARSLAFFAAGARAGTEDVPFTAEHFQQLAACRRVPGGDQSAVCRESLVLWAALWALATERYYETDLMGKVFASFDDSGDGWLQFSEFIELFEVLFPAVSKAETESLFLCGAEDATGDMTRDVFVSLVIRLGITTDLDALERVLAGRAAGRPPEGPT